MYKKYVLFSVLIIVSLFCNGQNLADKTKPILWYESKTDFDPNKIDVLYFVSTEVLSAKDNNGNVSWQSTLVPDDVTAMMGEIAWVENNMFYNDFNLSAPFYHQFTFDAICQLDKDSLDIIYKKVADEAINAFDYYMQHINHGRPFVLAGFSQGAMLTLDILKHMTDSQFSQLVACYTLGYRLSAKNVEHPHIIPAQSDTDCGVVVSFNSVQTTEAIWPLVSEGAVTCINPVNWHTDSNPATFTFDGTTNQVHVDPVHYVLVVNTDSPSYFHDFYKKAPFFLDAGVNINNLHHWDLLFYGSMIHDNALVRAKSKLVR